MNEEEKLWKEEGIVLVGSTMRNAPVFLNRKQLNKFSNADLKRYLLDALDELVVLRYRRGFSWMDEVIE
jgi:hypothetical protein